MLDGEPGYASTVFPGDCHNFWNSASETGIMTPKSNGNESGNSFGNTLKFELEILRPGGQNMPLPKIKAQ